MSIFIDSAVENEVQQARQLGWVRGVTTNPTLLAQTGQPAEVVLEKLSKIGFNSLFYQLTAQTPAGMQAELEAAQKIVGKSLVLKVPPTELGFRFVAEHGQNFPFCLTAVYSPAQAAVAAEAGARYIAVYVNRATRLLGDGIGLVRSIAKVLANSQTETLAASIKSSEEAGGALEAGAQHLTVPFHVLSLLTTHPQSVLTVAQFEKEGVGIRLPESVRP